MSNIFSFLKRVVDTAYLFGIVKERLPSEFTGVYNEGFNLV